MSAAIEKKIFISSTSLDLGRVRDQVFDVCQMIGGRTVMMKHFVNAHEDPTGVSLYELEQCDWFIGIYARRYGTISTANGKSITENEYDHALALKQNGRMQMWCFVLSPTADWPGDDAHTDTGEQATRLLTFLTHVRSRMIGEFQSVDDLLKQVAVTISKEYIFMLNGGYRFVDSLRDYPLPDGIWLPNKPYVGLSNYTRATAPVFFGRGRVVAALIKRVEGKKPLISLYGQSGVGKSSILAAGLLPRLERQGWQVLFIRRDVQQGVHWQVADVLVLVAGQTQPTVVVFDQLEEIWTNPNRLASVEEESRHFFDGLARLITFPSVRTVLSFRKEFLSEIKRELDIDNRFPYTEFPVFGLTQEEIIEAIYQISQDEDCRQEYRIDITESLPHQMAYDLRTGDQAQIAPLLQVTLTRMYEAANAQRKDTTTCTFDEPLYGQVRTESLTTFLNEQIRHIASSFPEIVANGLLLDLLNYFTTDTGTAGEHPLATLLLRYAHVANLIALVNAGVNTYLLLKNEQDGSLIRLSHDALAPVVQTLYRSSTAPGQQAARLLDSKSVLPESDNLTLFSEADLKTLVTGRAGMRTWTEAESAAYDHSRQATDILQRTLQERQKLAIRALSNGLAKDSRLALERKQFSQAVRLAEKALEVDETNEQALERLINGHHHLPTLNELQGHTYFVNSAVFSPDGHRILTASTDYTARLWDAQGKPLTVLEGHTYSVNSTVFSPDGRLIFTASDDNTARLWDAEGKHIVVLKGHSDPVNASIFSPDGRLILTASSDHTARLWDTHGKSVAVLKGHKFSVKTATFSPDGSRILTASYDNTARLWDAAGKLVAVLKGHSDPINTAIFSPDGRLILTVSYNTARLWDAEGKPLTLIDSVNSAVFFPDSRRILTASSDNTARLWDTQGGLLAVLEGHTDSVESAVFSPNGSQILIASWDNTARLWDSQGEPLSLLRGHTGPINTAVFSPDGRWILTASRDSTARLWDSRGKPPAVLNSVNSAVFLPNSSRILIALGDNARLWDAQGKQLSDGRRILIAPEYSRPPSSYFQRTQEKPTTVLKSGLAWNEYLVNDAIFSPDGRLILSASDNNIAHLWDAQGKHLAMLRSGLPGNKDSVNSAVFAPDSRRILTASTDRTARLWDTHGELLAILTGHTDRVNMAIFSPDGRLILSASSDNTARLWHTEGKPLAVLEGHTYSVNSAVFSPDGRLILTASDDNTARLWDAEGNLLAVLNGHTSSVRMAIFSPNSCLIVTASTDNTARLWDTKGKSLTVLEGHIDAVYTAIFSPDGHRIMTASGDTARLWNVAADQIKTDINYRRICILTWEELKQYGIDSIEQAAGIDRVAVLLAAEPHEMSLYHYARYYYEIARTQTDVSSAYLAKSLRLYDRLIDHWPLQLYQKEREKTQVLFSQTTP